MMFPFVIFASARRVAVYIHISYIENVATTEMRQILWASKPIESH